MSALRWAIEREDWELAALCLLYGMARAAAKLAPETLDELIEELEPGPVAGRGARVHKVGRRGHRR